MKLNRPVNAIPLRRAALCSNCDAVYSLEEWDACPSCADEHFTLLANIVPPIATAAVDTDAYPLSRGD